MWRGKKNIPTTLDLYPLLGLLELCSEKLLSIATGYYDSATVTAHISRVSIMSPTRTHATDKIEV